MATGCCRSKRTRRPEGLMSSHWLMRLLSWLSVRTSVWTFARNGYCCKALCVSPPPQGFSQASFSSKRRTSRPPAASIAPAKAPAGPPPTMAMGCCVGICWPTYSVSKKRNSPAASLRHTVAGATASSPRGRVGRDARKSASSPFIAEWWRWSAPGR